MWVKQGCEISYCLRHNITWKAEDKHDNNTPRDTCPECRALGLKGADWIAE
jgi:hypothetical protein